MTTVNDLLVAEIEKLKADNAKLQERIKTVEATNRELRKESSRVQMELYNQTEELKQARINRDDYERMTTFIKLFKETFKIADEKHEHDDRYKLDYD